MLKTYMFTLGHRKFPVRQKARHVWNDSKGLSSLCGRSCNSTVWENTIEISNLRSRGSFGKVPVIQGREEQVPVNEDEGMDTFERPLVDFGEMAETTGDRVRVVGCGERCNESAQEGPVAGKSNAVNLEAVRSSDARAQDRHENLSYAEMMERWEFLKRLPHKLQRDIGYIIVGPSLLSTSKELPTVSTSTLGGSSAQWPITKAWLRQLSIPAVEAWFASHRSSQRLGDHFALCIEYVLRHSPHVEVQQLLTSQQVLQRVTEPVRNSKALKALESKLLAQKNSSWCKTPLVVEPVSDDKPHIPLSPRVGSLQDEQQQVLSECRPTTLDESIQILESMDLNDKSLGVVGGTLQEKMGKRKRKLLKKLERVRLRKGKTTTIGEFDFLFEIPADGDLKGKEFHHWEVSVKYLLYAGPWEVFGVRSPMYAAWSNPDIEDSDPKLDTFSQKILGMESCGGAVSAHGSGSMDDGGSVETKTTTADVCNGLNSSRAEEKNCHENAAEDDKYLSVENPGEDNWTTQEHPREVDNFLGCYLGPHVGETLLDRKARLRNQLALSANPCAALMLRDLYINKGTDDSSNYLDKRRNVKSQTVNIDESAEKERMEDLASIPLVSTQVGGGVATIVKQDRQGVTEEDSDGGSSSEGAEDLVVVPSALLKGFLFYEYELWRFLECQSDKFKDVKTQDSLLTDKASLNRNHWMGWWTRDIIEFADLPLHQHSKWYIVPKLEWLSPVVIPQSDADRCARVLSLSDFVVTAAQVADEAARLLMPRKRRFLVAEVRWTRDWEPCHESGNSPTCASASAEEQATMGAWLEVSRGFVVEDTWPVSKMYRPHGYVVSWSLSLQGRQVDVPEM